MHEMCTQHTNTLRCERPPVRKASASPSSRHRSLFRQAWRCEYRGVKRRKFAPFHPDGCWLPPLFPLSNSTFQWKVITIWVENDAVSGCGDAGPLSISCPLPARWFLASTFSRQTGPDVGGRPDFSLPLASQCLPLSVTPPQKCPLHPRMSVTPPKCPLHRPLQAVQLRPARWGALPGCQSIGMTLCHLGHAYLPQVRGSLGVRYFLGNPWPLLHSGLRDGGL